MNRSITRGQKPGQHKPRLHKPDPTMFHNSLPTQSRKDRNPVDRRSFDDAEADSLSERFAATTSTRLVRVTAGNGQILGDRQSDGSTQPARPRHGCDGAWFEIEPQRAPGPMWLLESADRSRVRVVVASKTLRNASVRSADQCTSGNEWGMIEADSSEALRRRVPIRTKNRIH